MMRDLRIVALRERKRIVESRKAGPTVREWRRHLACYTPRPLYVTNDDDHRTDANDEHSLVALSLIVRLNPRIE
jgi:hypothetical protein